MRIIQLTSLVLKIDSVGDIEVVLQLIESA